MTNEKYQCPVCETAIRATHETDDDGQQLWECPGDCRIRRLVPGGSA